jgi:hypothetical protein
MWNGYPVYACPDDGRQYEVWDFLADNRCPIQPLSAFPVRVFIFLRVLYFLMHGKKARRSHKRRVCHVSRGRQIYH